MMQYKGYIAHVGYDHDDRCFSGLVLNITDIIHFEGETVEELAKNQPKWVDQLKLYMTT